MVKVLVEAVEKKRIVAIFGCSKLGAEIHALIMQLAPQTEMVFVDNSRERWGTQFCECRVYAPEEIIERKALFIVASERFYDSMTNQIKRLGVEEEDIFFPDEVLHKKLQEAEQIIAKRTPKKTINFVVDLAEHCNLNCQNCDHFSPLAKEKYQDYDTFRKDIARMAELFGGHGEYITSVDLEGGEPLLNPEVEKYISVVHEFMPNTKVRIFTNGTLLLKKEEAFWNTCRKHGVTLEITKYPIAFDYDGIVKKAEEENVDLQFFYDGEVAKTSMHKPMDLSGSQDKYESFHGCYMANADCMMLKEGKFYPCTLIPNLSTFNEFFEQDVKVCKKDYIDIYKVESKEEIFEFLANPVPACRYCQPKKWTYGHEWGVTRKEIGEWT